MPQYQKHLKHTYDLKVESLKEVVLSSSDPENGLLRGRWGLPDPKLPTGITEENQVDADKKLTKAHSGQLPRRKSPKETDPIIQPTEDNLKSALNILNQVFSNFREKMKD